MVKRILQRYLVSNQRDCYPPPQDCVFCTPIRRQLEQVHVLAGSVRKPEAK